MPFSKLPQIILLALLICTCKAKPYDTSKQKVKSFSPEELEKKDPGYHSSADAIATLPGSKVNSSAASMSIEAIVGVVFAIVCFLVTCLLFLAIKLRPMFEGHCIAVVLDNLIAFLSVLQTFLRR